MFSPKPNIARRRQEKKRKRQERLKRKRVQQPLSAQSATLEWAGLEKMSVVLERFVEPYRDHCADEVSFRKLLTVGAVAWNAALLTEDKRMALIDSVLSKHPVPGVSEQFVLAFLQELIDRKLAYFSTNRRTIIDFDLTDTGDGYHLNVVSSLPLPPAS